MMIPRGQIESLIWRPQKRLVVNIGSPRQLSSFNDTGGIAVYLDTQNHEIPDIRITGSQSEDFSLWDTRSNSGFITKPKFSADLVTIRFVVSGHIVYKQRSRDLFGSVTHATLTGFEDNCEVVMPGAVSTLSATFAVKALVAANEALTGNDRQGLPPLAPLADMSAPGMRALFCTVQQVQRRIGDLDQPDDLLLPLVKEIIGYQLLSSWPKQTEIKGAGSREPSSRQLKRAIEYIQENLSRQINLADISGASGMSVRSLQDKFRKQIGQTPVQFIIDQRLARAHQDLISFGSSALSIQEIARRWGFVHISDFGQRYRRLYGCTPTETRRGAGISQGSETQH